MELSLRILSDLTLYRLQQMAERAWASFSESHLNLSVPTAVVLQVRDPRMGNKRDVSNKRSDKHTEILHLLYYGELTPGGSKGCKKRPWARMRSGQAKKQLPPLLTKLYGRDQRPATWRRLPEQGVCQQEAEESLSSVAL